MTRLMKHPDLLRLLCVVLLILIAALDYVTGSEISLFILYFIPVALAAWELGRSAALTMAVGGAMADFLVDLALGHAYTQPWFLYWNAGILLICFVLAALGVDIVRGSLERERRLNADLAESLHQVKQLSGLLPMCASCKRIRNDAGYWEQVEEYIRGHSEAVFSHGICPECLRRLYPDYGPGDRRPPDAHGGVPEGSRH